MDTKFPRPWRVVEIPAYPEDEDDAVAMDAYCAQVERHACGFGRTSAYIEAANGAIILYLDVSEGEYRETFASPDALLAVLRGDA